MSKIDLQSLTATIRALDQKLKSQALNKNRGTIEPLIPEFEKKNVADIVKRQVFIRVVFLNIGEIDTVNEKYTADIFVHGRWREPSFDDKEDVTAEEIDWTQYWNPQLSVDNLLKSTTKGKWFTVTHDSHGEAMVHAKQRIKGTFLEYMELKQFPFDTQDLTITVASELGEREIELLEDDQEMCGMNKDTFMQKQSWHLHSSIFTWAKVTTKVIHSSAHKHPGLSVACKASRRPGFFIWNIILPMFVICSLSFVIFAVKLQLVPNRLLLQFILLLTTVSFKFVVTRNLPKISYNTYLDKYILCSMIFLCCVAAWHSVVFWLDKNGHIDATFADRIAFYVLISLWAFFQLFFFILVACTSYYNKNILAKAKAAYSAIKKSRRRTIHEKKL